MKKIKIDELDFSKVKNLIPVVVQNSITKEVLMVAYTNREALRETIRTKQAHYWSRSRGKIWKKGETSGHTQKVKCILVDCDADTLLFIVEQVGPACHTGKKTCFYNELESF